MANHYSALKRAKQTERRNVVNGQRRTRLRHQLRAIRRKLEANDAPGAEELLPRTFSLIDRSAKWGIIKDNAAGRYKSRLVARIRKVQAAT